MRRTKLYADFIEDDVQKHIVKQLRWMLTPRTVFFHVPNQGKRSRRSGKKLKDMGMLPGVPDLVFLDEGRFLAIELKKDSESEISEDQRKVHNMIRTAGGRVATCRTLKEVIDRLDEWGVQLVARVMA